MKKIFLLLMFTVTIFFTCKKKEETPPVVVIPDYADLVVGTYLGSEVRKAQDNWTVEYSNGSKTMTLEKLDKNKVQLKTFTSGPMPTFTLSDGGTWQGNQIITFTSTSNPYGSSRYLQNQLSIDFANGYTNGQPGQYTRYYYYDGTKQ
jgi:hypothetical protein